MKQRDKPTPKPPTPETKAQVEEAETRRLLMKAMIKATDSLEFRQLQADIRGTARRIKR